LNKVHLENQTASAWDESHTAEQNATGYRQSIRETLKRYCSIALIIAVVVGGALILLDQRLMGKGLILGTLFSVINFILMATVLPMRVGLGRKKAFFFSLGSIHLRFALMAIPLVISFKYGLYVISAVAVGLFMVQIAILGEQLWIRLRNPERVKC